MNNILDTLKTAPHEQIPDLAHEKFVEVYSQKFGSQNAEVFFEEQKNLFIAEMASGSYKDSLKQADGASIYFAFLFLAINGLSIEKGSTTTCYLECKRVKVGEKQGSDGKNYPVYQPNAVISVTGYGEIILRQRAGQITSVDSPKVVYDCDSLRFGEREGKSFLEYEKCIPRPKGSKVIACYVRIVKKDGTIDYFVLDTDEILRLKQYSGRANKYWDDQKHQYIERPNALYGKAEDGSDIDTGFLKSKTVKHAFKGYPKLSIGAGGAFEADRDIEQTPAPEIQGGDTPVDGVKAQTDDNDPFNQ